jgi:hypothetical protein
MQRYRLIVLLGFLLAFSFVVFGSPALAATPSFTITGTNVTMSSSTSSGAGSSSFTLTSVNGYTGTVSVRCAPPLLSPPPPGGLKVPYCGNGGLGAGAIPVQPPITLTANEVVMGTIPFFNSPVPCSNPCPASLPQHRGHGLAQGLALAGALLLGFGFRRRRARWLTLTLLAIGALAGLAGISACGANNNVVTPGTYAYTITATDVSTSVSVTTSVSVMVP